MDSCFDSGCLIQEEYRVPALKVPGVRLPLSPHPPAGPANAIYSPPEGWAQQESQRLLEATWEWDLGDSTGLGHHLWTPNLHLHQGPLGPHLVSDKLCCAAHLASGTHTAPATTGRRSRHPITAPLQPALNSCGKPAHRGLGQAGGQSLQCLCSWHHNVWPAERAAWSSPGPRPSQNLPAPNTEAPQAPCLTK